ncbi:unnamed protein product [Ixodes hexagonus]
MTHHLDPWAENDNPELPWVLNVMETVEAGELQPDLSQFVWGPDWSAPALAAPQDLETEPVLGSPNTASVNQKVVDWPGDSGFSVVFDEPHKTGKSMSWTYSKSRRKLYVNMNVSCPVHFATERPPPRGSVVCVVGAFRESESRRQNVGRCPVHAGVADNSNQLSGGTHPFPDHWIRCDHPDTRYCRDEANGGRHCLSVPFEAPEPASNHLFTYRLAFMCRNSCAGGPNRRATEVVFILQSPDGQDIARRVIEVKVCACPGRDRMHDEQPSAPAPTHSSSSPHNESSSDSGSEGPFFLTVRPEDYPLLRRVHEGLELARAVRLRRRRLEASVKLSPDD